MKPIEYKAVETISYEWDQIAANRAELIKNGDDISFDNVLVPGVLKAIDKCDLTKVVDCGCGTGALTRILSKKTSSIIGIDISKNSINIAQQLAENDSSNIKFINTSIEEFAQLNPESATTCIANMVLINITNLLDAIKSVKQLLKPGGKFVFTITHPCYWPIYWNYWNENWFNYRQEIVIESDFSITRCKNIGISTHIHRPLSMYVDALIDNDFEICEIKELYPDIEIQDYNYSYPRFICFKCVI